MRNILVLNNEAVLGAAIASLLQAEEDLELFGFTPSSPADLIDTLGRSGYLDVLILDNTVLTTNDVRRFLTQLNAQLGTCVIVVDTSNNLVTVNNIYDISIRQPEDLIEIVRHDLPRFSTHVRGESTEETVTAKHTAILRNTETHKLRRPKHRRPLNPSRCCTHRKPNLT
ncbi:MAG: hypothetical protein U0175_20870 [Caldilineaceae bacterium]